MSNTSSAATSYPASHYFVLRVALDQIKPPIWRRIVVPASITLDLLHDVLQVCMGWEDYHLHRFTVDGQRYTEKPEEPEEGDEETGIMLSTLISRARAKFAYLYDYGDSWCHTVTVEELKPIPDRHVVEISCIGGKRRCPPEDVGGVDGFAEYLNAIGNQRHKEHKAMLRWRGAFDAEDFDIDDVNHELAKLVRWSRPRVRPAE